MAEVNSCCGTTCDKSKAVKEHEDLVESLSDSVELLSLITNAYALTQSNDSLEVQQGEVLLRKYILGET